MVAVQDGKPPLVGAGVATCLTIVALILLLVLVYTTVSAHESHQHLTAAQALQIYADLLPRAPPDVAARLCQEISCLLPLLDQMPPPPPLDAARRRLVRVMEQQDGSPAGSAP
ncbi:hypothetical protein SAMN04487968_10935 [Nocardioides terrae]|uniref:Uncharacterized protein n=1 Tax=Nocardioides terrae TaxID=574651 RepID=A0A1I1KVV3_9ACTN|nr:hypothetical protein [Nocardioides terrae]SFC64934.1 hypothetical protein SAMN04487968_10935 [Nocardioides terrae]